MAVRTIGKGNRGVLRSSEDLGVRLQIAFVLGCNVVVKKGSFDGGEGEHEVVCIVMRDRELSTGDGRLRMFLHGGGDVVMRRFRFEAAAILEQVRAIELIIQHPPDRFGNRRKEKNESSLGRGRACWTASTI